MSNRKAFQTVYTALSNADQVKQICDLTEIMPGTKQLLYSKFPKKCHSCKVVYPDRESYITGTKEITSMDEFENIIEGYTR